MVSRRILLQAAAVVCMGVLGLATPEPAIARVSCENTDGCSTECPTGQAGLDLCQEIVGSGCTVTGIICGEDGGCGSSLYRIICTSRAS